MKGSNCMTKILLLIFLKSIFYANVFSKQIRGVPTSKLSFYDPKKDFTCLDGTVTVPFSYINDDYCDCPDGSDEPGTSACPNGKFTCKNLGHVQAILQSSRVNDGVCDCCDGTDEYDSDIACGNHCEEAGRAERERREKERIVAQQGFEIKTEYMQKGKEKRTEIETEQDDLKSKLTDQKAKLEEIKSAKEKAESFEKEAKEKQDKEFEELEKQWNEEQNLIKSEEAFGKLDADGNGMVTIQEFASSAHTSVDTTEEQAKEKFAGEEQVDKLKFYELWSSVKDLYISNAVKAEETTETDQPKDELEKASEESDTQDQKATDLNDDEHYDEDDDDQDDGEGDPAESKPPVPVPPPIEDKDKEAADQAFAKPEYSEETKRLISIADQARKEFSEVESEISSIESKISQNEKILGIDFGPNNEFLALHGECFEYTDREYVYKLCPFNSATQSSKSGGGDTNLGGWGEWHGSPNVYSKMKYKDGLSCWNGPNRSTDVSVSCGAKNEITSVSEPNRCEYVMEFKTPAMCNDPSQIRHGVHEEL